jgi:hypothetical protein
MRKTLVLLAMFALAAVPAFAQHGHGNGGNRGGNGGNRGGGGREQHGSNASHAQRQPKQDNRGRGRERDDHINGRGAERDFHRDHDRGGYHFSDRHRDDFRRHWDGRRFDHEFWESHWGYRHPFYWGHCGWYGPRWAIGSYFWYDGLYFEVVDEIPAYWYDGQVVIVYDEACDCYYAINDAYPGVRIHVGVRF